MNERSRRIALFPLGRLLATPGALEVLTRGSVDGMALLGRHVQGDWGNVPPEDAAANAQAVRKGTRILSSYNVGDERLWIITEADRSVTTLLLPSEY